MAAWLSGVWASFKQRTYVTATGECASEEGQTEEGREKGGASPFNSSFTNSPRPSQTDPSGETRREVDHGVKRVPRSAREGRPCAPGRDAPMTLENAVRQGNFDLVAQLADEMVKLAHQGKANAVQELMFGAHRESQPVPMHSVTKLQGPEKQDITLGCSARMIQGALLPIIEGRLYLTSASSSAAVKPKKRELWVALNKGSSYSPLCADFGPLNLGTTHRMCKKLHGLLSSPERRKIIFCTSTEAADITNTVTLLGAFLCLRMGFSLAQALRPFEGLKHGLIIPFRDATWVKSTFDLHVEDCLAGLQRAVSAGIYKQDDFCDAEYFYYDDPIRGDMHEVVPGKFIAFRGPVHDDRKGEGESTLSASDYLDVFHDKNVSTIVRLNSIQYSSAVFKRAGFQHFELPFQDCGVPSDSIVDKFLRIAEEAQGVVAVHCLAGLGRTGTLIALYLMKHHGFTACEAIGWLRICRPGSIIGPQQHYLEQQESRMHILGFNGCAGLGDLAKAAKMQRFPASRARVADVQKSLRRVRSCEMEMESIKEEKISSVSVSSASRTSSLEEEVPDSPSDGSFLSQAGTGVQPHSDMIAGMVTQGMLRRDCLKLGCLPRSNTWNESRESDRQGAAAVSAAFQAKLAPIHAKSESNSLHKQSTPTKSYSYHLPTPAHDGVLFPSSFRSSPLCASATISAKSTNKLCEEKGGGESRSRGGGWSIFDDVTTSAIESFSSPTNNIRSILDPEHFEYAKRLITEVGQHPYISSVNKLPPVEWGSFVRSHYPRLFFDYHMDVNASRVQSFKITQAQMLRRRFSESISSKSSIFHEIFSRKSSSSSNTSSSASNVSMQSGSSNASSIFQRNPSAESFEPAASTVLKRPGFGMWKGS